MKNSALIRVFSIVLAILSVVLIFTGSLGIKKAYEDKSLNERRLKKLVSAADTYEELSAKLKGKDSYSKALTKFEKHEKDYNKSAAEHKTDLAIYTATQGGIREAREMIYANRKKAYDTLESTKAETLANLPAQVVAGAKEMVAAGFAEKHDMIIAGFLANYPYNPEVEEEVIAANAAAEAYYQNMVKAEQDKMTEESLANEIAEAKVQAEAGFVSAKDQIDAALQPAFDAIWREEKKLEEDAAELETEKTDLEKDYKKLNDEKKALDELKADEQRMTSCKVTLTNNENIKSAVDGGEELITASRNEITRFTDSMHHDFKYRVIACGLMLFAALMGLVDIPAAFEKTKSKFLLIAPVVLFVLCCGGAEGISLWLGRGNMYSAISAGAFGIIQLLLMIF